MGVAKGRGQQGCRGGGGEGPSVRQPPHPLLLQRRSSSPWGQAKGHWGQGSVRWVKGQGRGQPGAVGEAGAALAQGRPKALAPPLQHSSSAGWAGSCHLCLKGSWGLGGVALRQAGSDQGSGAGGQGRQGAGPQQGHMGGGWQGSQRWAVGALEDGSCRAAGHWALLQGRLQSRPSCQQLAAAWAGSRHVQGQGSSHGCGAHLWQGALLLLLTHHWQQALAQSLQGTGTQEE